VPKIVVLGEALIDLFAEKGTALHNARSLHPSPGGAPANVAVALARLGVNVGFIGKVGNDDFGRYLIELLASEGVDITHFTIDPRGPTMLAIVARPSATEQQFILYNGANSLLSADELSKEYIISAGTFIYSSITLATDGRDAVHQAVYWANDAGNQVIFDVNLRPLLWADLDMARQRINESIDSATVVKMNEAELEFVTGTGNPVVGSQQLINRGVQMCCVSLGADGAFFNNGNACGFVPSFSVDVKDTTGSGDAFVAGLGMQLNQLNKSVNSLDHLALYRIVSFANACGALTTTKFGAMSALPKLSAVEKLRRHTELLNAQG